jgi:hypothetical protein
MTELETALADNRRAVGEFIDAAHALDAQAWTTPRAAGKWTPAQVAEHLALLYEYNRKLALGTAGRGAPFFLRPLIRRIVMDSTLKAGGFTRKGRAPKIFQPSATPGPASEVLARLQTAVSGFESDLRSRHPETRATLFSPFFGTVGSTDYVTLQAIHTRHHRRQLPSA